MSTESKKTRMSVYLPASLKRRLEWVSRDKNLAMNDIIIRAVKDELDRYDDSYSAPDLVLDRLSEILNAQIAVAQTLNKQTDILDELRQEIEEEKNG